MFNVLQRFPHFLPSVVGYFIYVVIFEGSEEVHRDIHQYVWLIEFYVEGGILLYHQAYHPLTYSKIVHLWFVRQQR